MPGKLFFLLEETNFVSPIWAAIPPEVEVEGIKFTGVRVKIVNEKTHGFRRHKELESTIAKKRSLEMAGRATNGGLKDERHRIRCELEFASAKSNNKSKRRGSQIGQKERPGSSEDTGDAIAISREKQSHQREGSEEGQQHTKEPHSNSNH
jgi:hypothetical protein